MNGKRILVTRSAEQAPALSHALAGLGASPVVVPTIEIVPPKTYADLDQAIVGLADFDFLVLTSVNAVKAFCDRIAVLDVVKDDLKSLKTVAVGPKSAAAFAGYGFHADLVPDDYRAEGVVAMLSDKVAGKRILYPKAALARDLIPSALSKAGAEVIAPEAYGSAPPAEASAQLKQALGQGLDLLTFTASSTVDNFVNLLDVESLALARKVPVASIGPLTTNTAEKLGFHVDVEPDNSTLDDMIVAIRDYFEKN